MILDQRKKTKMQCLQDPNQSTVDDPNNARHEANGHLRIKKKEYLKAKIDEPETNSKIKNIRDLYRGNSDFKKSYQPRPNTVKDEKGGLVTDCHSISARWRNHFSQLLYVQEFNDVRQTEIYTSDPLVPEPSMFDVEMSIKKLRRHKSLCIDQIKADFIKAGGRKLHSGIQKNINCAWKKVVNA